MSEPKWTLNNICLFCASSTPKNQKLQDACVETAKEMLSRKIGLVYGGGTMGLMGVVGKTVFEGGGKVLGIIPGALKSREQNETFAFGEQIVVDSMHERKFMMYKKSDGFIALPGGFGTLDELLEVLTWAQIGIHNKPVGLLNVDGFFDGLLQFIKTAQDNGLISNEACSLLLVSKDPKELIDMMSNHVPAESIFKWPVNA